MAWGSAHMLLIFAILFSILLILYTTFCHKARCICDICIKTFYFLSFFQNFHHGFSPADICICKPEEILYNTMNQDTRVCSQIFHMQFFSHFPPHSVFSCTRGSGFFPRSVCGLPPQIRMQNGHFFPSRCREYNQTFHRAG